MSGINPAQRESDVLKNIRINDRDLWHSEKTESEGQYAFSSVTVYNFIDNIYNK